MIHNISYSKQSLIHIIGHRAFAAAAMIHEKLEKDYYLILQIQSSATPE